MHPSETNRPEAPVAQEQRKKTYVAPKLIVHGTIERLTQAVIGTPSDGNIVAPGSALG